MRRTRRLLFLGLAVFALARLVSARRWTFAGRRAGAPGAPLLGLRDFVTHRFDPAVERLGLVGGPRSPWATLEHVGRTSGHVYRTPVAPRPTGDGFEIPLPYGPDVHWVQNLLATGHARMQLHETIYELDRPEVVAGEDARSLSAPVRRLAARQGWHYLRVHTASAIPGTFSHLDGHPVAFGEGEPAPMTAESPYAAFLPHAGPVSEAPAEPKMTGIARPEMAATDR